MPRRIWTGQYLLYRTGGSHRFRATFNRSKSERILASCDLTTPVGKRDHAILLLLGRLGLRAGDIVDLRLSDLDWQDAWVQVCGKGRHQTRLPMTQELGDALVAYLRHGRPPTDADRCSSVVAHRSARLLLIAPYP